MLSPAEGAPDQPEHPLDMPLHIRDDGVASWLVLRHQPPPAQGCPWPFVRRQAPAFSTASTIEWLTALRSAGLEFLLPEAYFARLKSRAPGQPAVNPAALLKHDIHHDFRRVVRMAEREAEAGISAVYFMMDHHELNAGFWGLDYTWRELRRIQDMGHQIGLHVDTFELILRYGDLMTGLKVFKQVFEDQGLSIIAANAHGNTKLGKRTGLRPMDFFSGLSRAAPPQPTELEQHVRRYTLGEVGKAGIHYWLDAAFMKMGPRFSATIM